MLDDFFFVEGDVGECRQFGRFRVQVLESPVVVEGEDVSVLRYGYRGTESNLVIENHLPGYHVEIRRSVVRLQIKMVVLPGNDVPDLVAGKVIHPVLGDESLQGAAVPDVQAVHGSDIQMPEGVLVDGADGIVGEALL